MPLVALSRNYFRCRRKHTDYARAWGRAMPRADERWHALLSGLSTATGALPATKPETTSRSHAPQSSADE